MLILLSTRLIVRAASEKIEGIESGIENILQITNQSNVNVDAIIRIPDECDIDMHICHIHMQDLTILSNSCDIY